MHHAGAAEEAPAPIAVMEPVSFFVSCKDIVNSPEKEAGSFSFEKSHVTLGSDKSGTSNSPGDTRPRKGPSAKRKWSLEEYQRSREISARSLRNPPPPLERRQSTPDWDRSQPQYDRFGVQIFDDSNGLNQMRRLKSPDAEVQIDTL